MGSVERIAHVASKVKATRDAGHDVVVVVSAMSGETNRLIGMAKQIQDDPTPREMDVLEELLHAKTTKEIAASFDVGIQTVAKHKANVLKKLGVSNHLELIRLIASAGFTEDRLA